MNLMEVAPRETSLESGGHVKGVAVAVVSDNKDDSGQGRVKVKYPWHSTPSESHWARVAMPMAGKDRGAYFIPEVNDEVLVAFERGDMRFPYVVGSLWNGKEKSPAGNGDGKNDLRLIRTRKGHKLTFDDGNKGLVQLELNDGKKLALDDDGITLDDGKGNRLTIKSRGGEMTIEAATKLTLKAPQIAVQANAKLDLTSSGVVTMSGTPVKIN